ncbi:Crp/Fnr family transcriptional regulator [Paenibacillus sp. LjRoot153]|uniref:Crp/Fnr family transcriptional regulator n=1 Tax=Paenibacillus sp. LjRoot153 TaxID=3342270 RepID=UPI003ECE187D
MISLNEHQIHNIQHVFPCFSHVHYENWKSAEIRTITTTTPHSVREGQILQHAIFIISGSIRVYKISPMGKEITLYRVHSGQCCVLMMASILGETEYEASVSIETETVVLLIPVLEFRGWMDTIKPIRQYIYKQFIDRMTSVTKLLENVAYGPIPYRIAEFLFIESARSETLQLTHDQLAVELGTAREVITRNLKNFASMGAIALQRGKVTILSRDILKSIMDQHV